MSQERLSQEVQRPSVASTSNLWRKVDQCCMIFDWDDTLCPSSWLVGNRPDIAYFDPPPDRPEFRVPLNEVAKRVVNVLRAAKAVGTVVLVTAAQPGWVEASAKNFLPAVVPELEGVEVIYARSVFARNQKKRAKMGKLFDEQAQGSSPGQLWKTDAIHETLSKFYGKGHSWKNIVSIGDSPDEQIAVQDVTVLHQNPKSTRTGLEKDCRVKTVKMLDAPTIQLLITQLDVLTHHVSYMARSDASFDLTLELQNAYPEIPLEEMNAKKWHDGSAGHKEKKSRYEHFLANGADEMLSPDTKSALDQIMAEARMSVLIDPNDLPIRKNSKRQSTPGMDTIHESMSPRKRRSTSRSPKRS